jgi:hypothetical protein
MRQRSIHGPGPCRRVAVLMAIAMSASLSPARAADVEHKFAGVALSRAVSALRPIFALAGPPNFQVSIAAEFDNGGTIKVSRQIVSSLAAGLVRMPFSERKLLSSGTEHRSCRLDGVIIAFFSGVQLASASGAAECGGASSEVDGRLTAVSGVRGELFPLQAGNELSFTTKAQSEIVDLYPSAVHRLSVVGMLSGVTLNVTGAPDMIYLIRNDEAPDGAKTPIVTDIYWSAGLRWPIQTRMRTADGKITLVESNLLQVAGVTTYVLPDGRTVSTFDERPTRSHPLAELDAIARALGRAAKSKATQDIHAAAEAMAKVVDPKAQPSAGIDPAFASIASFVTQEEAIQ